MTQTTMQQTQPQPWTQSPENPPIFYDLFPCSVTAAPGLSLSKVRVLLTGAAPSSPPSLYVFSDAPQGPSLVLRARYDPSRIHGDTRSGLDVYAGLDPADPATASVVAIRPEGGCGCGSRVRSLRPFTTERHSQPPPSAGPVPAPPVLPATA
jgi:hypothetical protein